jgi:formylglycine-generating enzyme required for sulfatase activity
LKFIFLRYKLTALVTFIASISLGLGFLLSLKNLSAEDYFYSDARLCQSYSGIPSESEEFVLISGGRFVMGSNTAYQEEAPAHQEQAEDFWISKHNVTNAQFSQFVAATGYLTRAEKGVPSINGGSYKGSAVFFQPNKESPGYWKFTEGANWRHPEGPNSHILDKDNFPVVHVTYEDAAAYAAWKGHDLPTEAQWEYAAKGGLIDQPYVWGKELNPGGRHLANTWQGNFPKLNLALDGHSGVSPVGCFAPNHFGLFDMAGNVWQITKSIYKPYHSTNKAVIEKFSSDDKNKNGTALVIKGGSHLCAPNYCMRYRPSARQPQDLVLGTSHVGFRTIINVKKNI